MPVRPKPDNPFGPYIKPGHEPTQQQQASLQRNRREHGESDSYSSSRNYREREREGRYGGDGGGRGGGDRRDRDWDRDRDRGSARRDARRDDDGRRRDNRRDRDLFDDRRRPRDDRDRRDVNTDRARDRDDMQQMERQTVKKEGSPERKAKEPTPDLTDIVSILQKKRRMTQWDIKPPGYENVTAEQAKLSGMFPLPGAPRQQPMDATRLKAFMDQPGGSANGAALKPSTARQSKRLFVYQLSGSATDDSVTDFFNLQLNGLNVTRGVDPCISAQISKDRSYALLEFKTPEDATNALALDGISMEPDAMDTSGGLAGGLQQGLQIKRPKDYITPVVTDEAENMAGVLSTTVPDSQYKISITNIPAYIEEAQVQELLVSFGELKHFVLVTDTSSGQSRGIAFCEYTESDPTTDVAVESLNGMELGDSVLKVQRASVGIQQMSGEMSVNAMSMMAGTTNTNTETSRVLCLMNMITTEELMNELDADGTVSPYPTCWSANGLLTLETEILEDVQEECAKYGPVVEVKMPRPTGGSRQNNGIGKIYVKYEKAESAMKALAALAGRKFADRTVVVTVFGEEYFDVNAW